MAKSELAKLEQQKQELKLDLIRAREDAHRTRRQSKLEKYRHDQVMKREKTEWERQRERESAKRATVYVERPDGVRLYFSNDVDFGTLTKALQNHHSLTDY